MVEYDRINRHREIPPLCAQGGWSHGVYSAYHNLEYGNPLTIDSLLATEIDMVL